MCKSIVEKISIILLSLFVFACSEQQQEQATSSEYADIVFKDGEIYTVEEDRPWANSLAVTGNKIVAITDTADEIDAFIGPDTQVIELNGRFVAPGFIDAHTHFGGFGARLNSVYLMAVEDVAGLRAELERVVPLVGENEWLTGGRWEGNKQWDAKWQNVEEFRANRMRPSRADIDDVTPNNPVLLDSYDAELYLANTKALEIAGLLMAPVDGMDLNEDGSPTGLINKGSPAIEMIESYEVGKSHERVMNEIRAGIREMNSVGVVEIHDMVDDAQLARYVELQNNDELNLRVWARPHLLRAQEIADRGFEMNTHPVSGERDRYLRHGAYKAHYDGLMGSHGALLAEPYADRPDTRGHYRDDTSDDPNRIIKNPEKYIGLGTIARNDGFTINTHAIGSQGIKETLDDFEAIIEATGKPLNRARVIHAQTTFQDDFQRFADMDLIAEVNPNSIEDDMNWVIDRLGPEREKWVFPFKTYLDYGVMLTFGSDVPGAGGATFLHHPKYAIAAAVTRQSPEGYPEGGWIPEQRISVEEAMKAVTINAAYAAFDEDVRGSLKVGKLADIIVSDLNIIKVEPNRIMDMNIDITMVDGKIVYERN